MSEAATIDDDEADQKVMMINDVSRAFFEAKATRDVCVELPEEDKTEEDRRMDMVGHLVMSLYGTRDAATNWQEEVAREMRKWGFKRGRFNPCLYFNAHTGVRTLVHGDDFVSVGKRSAIKRLEEQLQERFEIKTTIVGRDEQREAREGKVLNRVIRLTRDGWELEADQRHGEMIIEEMGLTNARGANTPGEDEKRHEEEDNKKPLEPERARRFRSTAARANYLAQDRPDIMYAVKELCRSMSTPTAGSWRALKRLGRYLIDNPRKVFEYRWQGRENEAHGYSDSDWAGCRVTGKSTSGGAVMIGSHFIKAWSRTQNCVTLSSAEAELVAMTKLSAELIGCISMWRDWGNEVSGIVFGDSSAALAISQRRGCGKLRHINIGLLWIQEKSRNKELEFVKIKGDLNPADLMTKHVTNARAKHPCETLGLYRREGRAELGLRVQAGRAATKDVKILKLAT